MFRSPFPARQCWCATLSATRWERENVTGILIYSLSSPPATHNSRKATQKMYLEQIHFHNRPTFPPHKWKRQRKEEKTRHHRNPSDRKWVTQKKENPTEKNVNFSYASRPPRPTTHNRELVFILIVCFLFFMIFFLVPHLQERRKERGGGRGESSREENYGKFSFNLDVFFSVCTVAGEGGRTNMLRNAAPRKSFLVQHWI